MTTEANRPATAAASARIVRRLDAPRSAVYRALLDPRAIEAWMVPDGMTSEVHTFEARVGGASRVSLTYEAPDGVGKTSARTDTYLGRLVELVPDERVVEVIEFETADPALQGSMTVTFTLSDVDTATELHAVHENLPPGIEPDDNRLGWNLSLDKLSLPGIAVAPGATVRKRRGRARMPERQASDAGGGSMPPAWTHPGGRLRHDGGGSLAAVRTTTSMEFHASFGLDRNARRDRRRLELSRSRADRERDPARQHRRRVLPAGSGADHRGPERHAHPRRLGSKTEAS